MMLLLRADYHQVYQYQIDEETARYNIKQINMSRSIEESIYTELRPILTELRTVEKGNDKHHAVRKLFRWLADPQRTAEEFSYVIRRLTNDVYAIMKEYFPNFLYQEHTWMYLCRTTAEALGVKHSVKCPVSEDAWTLVMVTQDKQDGFYRVSNAHLSAWILNVIGTPDSKNIKMLCYQPHMLCDHHLRGLGKTWT